MSVNLFAILKNVKKHKEISKVKFVNISSDIQKELEKLIEIENNLFNSKNEVEFDGQYKPDQNEILVIEGFNFPYDNVNFDNPLNLEELTENDIDNIKGLIFNTKERLYIQCFDKRKIIQPNKLSLIYGNNTFSKFNNKGLILGEKFNVYYSKLYGKLLFYSFFNASKIFDLSDYYRVATEEEVNNFFNSGKFSFSEDINFNDIINNNIRKRIYLIQKNNVIEKLSDPKIFKEITKKAKEIGIDKYFNLSKNQIELPDNKDDLKKIIYLLNGDIYKSPILEKIYTVNSKKELNQK